MSLRRIVRAGIEKFGTRLLQAPVPNDEGVRAIEYSWVAANMPEGPGNALDFGCGNSWLGLLAARKGFFTTGVDLRELKRPFHHPSLEFKARDLVTHTLPPKTFNLILNISSIEHVGLERYGGELWENGDWTVMGNLRRTLTSGGKMLLTTNIGQSKLIPGVHRIYSEEELHELCKSWTILSKEFWIKNWQNQWMQSTSKKAFAVKGNDHYYALGLFVLEGV